MFRFTRMARLPALCAVFCACTSLAMLGACSFTGSDYSYSAFSTTHPQKPSLHETGVQRLQQIDARINNLRRRINARIGTGERARELRRRLDAVRADAHNIASQNRGELSVEQQNSINERIAPISRAINR
jgi:hypothetical protein